MAKTVAASIVLTTGFTAAIAATPTALLLSGVSEKWAAMSIPLSMGGVGLPCICVGGFGAIFWSINRAEYYENLFNDVRQAFTEEEQEEPVNEEGITLISKLPENVMNAMAKEMNLQQLLALKKNFSWISTKRISLTNSQRNLLESLRDVRKMSADEVAGELNNPNSPWRQEPGIEELLQKYLTKKQKQHPDIQTFLGENSPNVDYVPVFSIRFQDESDTQTIDLTKEDVENLTRHSQYFRNIFSDNFRETEEGQLIVFRKPSEVRPLIEYCRSRKWDWEGHGLKNTIRLAVYYSVDTLLDQADRKLSRKISKGELDIGYFDEDFPEFSHNNLPNTYQSLQDRLEMQTDTHNPTLFLKYLNIAVTHGMSAALERYREKLSTYLQDKDENVHFLIEVFKHFPEEQNLEAFIDGVASGVYLNSFKKLWEEASKSDETPETTQMFRGKLKEACKACVQKKGNDILLKHWRVIEFPKELQEARDKR